MAAAPIRAWWLRMTGPRSAARSGIHLPDGVTAALAWIGLERRYRGLRFGSYLLDRALAEMAHGGYTAVEVHAHTRENPEAVAMFRHRGFEVIDYWVNLAKT